MKIHDLIQMIPEESDDEALRSIQSIRIEQPRSARLTCHLSKKFFILLYIDRNNVIWINKEQCSLDEFLSTLRKEIYREDEAESHFVQLKEKVTYIRQPPSDMDIPVWDTETQSWYDAEY